MTTSTAAALQSSYMFPSQSQQQQRHHQANANASAFGSSLALSSSSSISASASSSSTSTASSYSQLQQQQQHTPQAGPSNSSNGHHHLYQQFQYAQSIQSSLKSSGSNSSGDPFAYDTASLRATARHTPASSVTSLASISNSSVADSSTSNRNKDLPPQPQASPLKTSVPSHQQQQREQQRQRTARPDDVLVTPSASASAHVAVATADDGSVSPIDSTSTPLPTVVEYVQALHDYNASAEGVNVCLSFKARDYIKVLNKDPSGWWDGEINGMRGWFPSNYVATEAYSIDHSPAYSNNSYNNSSDALPSASTSEPMRRAATSPAYTTSSHDSRPESPAFDPTRRPSSQDTVTAAVSHAINLMQNAVDANRLSHFRPASSCFVVAVKAILHATDTLAKESVILRTHLNLARQRKQILSNLANVMTLARLASSDQMDVMSRARETALMTQTAHTALRNVEDFLQLAMQCGVQVPARIDSELDQRSAQRLSNLQNISTPNLDACLQFPMSAEPEEMPLFVSGLASGSRSGPSSRRTTSSSSSSNGRGLQRTRSLSDVKQANRRKMSEASNASSGTGSSSHEKAQQYSFLDKPPSPNETGGGGIGGPRRPSHQMLRRPSIPAAYATSMLSPAWQANDSISSSVSSLNSSQGPLAPNGDNTPQQPTEVYRILTLIHDHLLSTIAAFIGHVHAHSRTSHSSSYAHLIDMTRESIERVRETLIIVDVVAAHPALSGFTRDLKYLAKYREALYMTTTALVTAARKATAPLSEDLTDETVIRDQEEEEKQELLKAATGVLRASADCVNSTKPLLLRRRNSDASFVIDLNQANDTSDLSRSSSGSTEAPPDEDATVQVPDSGIGSEDNTNMSGNRSGDKGRHTVSMLARKATNLAHVRDKQNDSEQGHLADNPIESMEELTGDEYEDAEEQGSLQRSQDSTWSEQPSSARSSRQYSRAGTPNSGERSGSSLSMRRGLPMPPNLSIQTRYPGVKGRPPSSDSMSATSTVTSMSRDKSATPAPAAAPLSRSLSSQPQSEPKSAGSTSTHSYESSKAGGEAMSRDESSRGSATSTATSSYRSGYSDATTAETSPRSSVAYSSPAEEKSEWINNEPGSANSRRSARTDIIRARSGSTPDRVAALRLSTGLSGQIISPLSPRLPQQFASPDAPTSPKNWLLERDYEPKECSFNADGNVTGGTLRCLVERMTLHDQTIDASFANTFFLTFRMFTTPSELTELLIARFNIVPPNASTLSEVEHKIWREQKLTPVRLRIYNFFKTWLESHWRPDSDAVIFETLITFTREAMTPAMPSAAQRLIDLIHKRAVTGQSPNIDGSRPRALTRMASTDKLKAGKPINDVISLGSATFPGLGASLPPPTIISKSLLSSLRTPPFAPNTILDFDPMELGRQFTIMESRLYCAISPEDLIGQEFGKQGTNRSANIRAMSSLSTRITGWIAEIILSEQDAKKRSSLLKYFIKLGDRCMLLQNYNTLMAILAALNSSTIARLKKTWDGLSNKHKATLEVLRKTTEHTRNYAQYRATIRSAIAPCLPFLGLTLTDLTFCQDGNSADRASPLDNNLRLINFDRYQKIAKIVHDVQRFQVPYNFVEIPEVQSFLHNALRNVEHGGDPQALYRRSLMVEPREPTSEYQGMPHSAGIKDTFGWRI